MTSQRPTGLPSPVGWWRPYADKNRLPLEDERIARAIDDIVRRLHEKDYDVNAGIDDRDAILADQVHHPDSRTVGGERVCLQALEQLGFAAWLRATDMKEEHVRMAIALVVARMMSPGSEAHTYRWMMSTSAILELLALEAPSLSTLYQVGDRLYALREPLLNGLFGNAQQLLGFDETLILYDIENVFDICIKQDNLLAYGRSKEKHANGPLVTLALTLDASGFVRGMQILPGNVSEPKTLRHTVETLGAISPTIIMDAGIATSANLKYLKEKGLHWICVQRSKTPPVPERVPDASWNTQTGTGVKAWCMEQKEGELHVYLQSEARKSTGDRILDAKRAKFEAKLMKLHEGLTKPRCIKAYDKVLLRVGRALEKHKRVSYQYTVEVLKKKNSTQAKAVQFTHISEYETQSLASGGYVLRTSHTDWSASEVARTYWRLADVERTFRTLESELGMRPINHRSDARIEVHLFLCILAYHAVQLIRTKLKSSDIHSSWATLQFELNQWHRITTVMPKDRRTRIVLKKDVDQGAFQRQIAMIMGLEPHNHTVRTLTEHLQNGSAFS